MIWLCFDSVRRILTMKMDNTKKVNCFQCVYYVNTWNPRFPRYCKFFGFKSTEIPSEVVYRNTGEQCISFVGKGKSK